MSSFANPFVEVVNQFNGIPGKSRHNNEDDLELTAIYQARQVKMYLTLRQVLDQVSQLLNPEEKIINLLPVTNENGSTVATNGLMGMYAPHSKKATAYIKEQESLRGNRLLIFTNKRMIFLVVLEFIDDNKQYYSYDYQDITSIKLKKHKSNEPVNENALKRQNNYWYTIDFQTAEGHVFTEIFNGRNAEQFKRNLQIIPGMQHIEISRLVKRKNKFDFIFSNINFATTTYQVIWIPLLILLVIFFVVVIVMHYHGVNLY